MAKKKTQGSDTEQNSLLNKTIDIIHDKFGEGIIQSLSDIAKRPLKSISTGSIGLDSIINPEIGGMVRGQVIEFWGPFSSGKTTLALGLCANATANKETVVYVDAEGALRPKSILDAGVNPDYFKYVDEIDARLTANIIEDLMKSGDVSIVVIDSIAAWKPLVEGRAKDDDPDFTKPKVADHSLFLSNTLPHLARVARKHDVIIILLNQERNDIGGYMAGGTKPFGGKVVEHTDSVRIKLTGTARAKTNQITDSDGSLIGQHTKAVCDKNKLSKPMQEVVLPVFLGVGVHPYMEVATLASKLGVVESTGGRYRFPGSDDLIAHGINNFVQKLYDDEEVYSVVRKNVIEKLGIKYPKDRKMVNAFHDENLKKRGFGEAYSSMEAEEENE